MFLSNCFFLPLIRFSQNLSFSQLDSKYFFSLNLNYLSTENSTLNYTLINLLSTKRLTPNLINSFVGKVQFLVKIYINKLSKLVNRKVPKKNSTKETHF